LTFPPNSSVPQKGYEKNFEKFVLLMEKDPSLNFRIETYTDPALKPAEQRALLRDRTAAILGLLADRGADRRRLTTEAAPTGVTPSGDASPQNAPPRGVVRLTLIEPAR
jgi:outer membrane protein OmpA-like peptidoglycan-associated protein